MCHQPPLFFCSSPISYTHALAFPDVCRDDVMADRRHWTPILLFSSRKHSSQTRQKSKALIRSQTTLTEQCLNQSSSPVISTVVWVFWVTACLSLNSHKGYPPSDPITHGKCFKCLCFYITALHYQRYLNIPEHVNTRPQHMWLYENHWHREDKMGKGGGVLLGLLDDSRVNKLQEKTQLPCKLWSTAWGLSKISGGLWKGGWLERDNMSCPQPCYAPWLDWNLALWHQLDERHSPICCHAPTLLTESYMAVRGNTVKLKHVMHSNSTRLLFTTKYSTWWGQGDRI